MEILTRIDDYSISALTWIDKRKYTFLPCRGIEQYHALILLDGSFQKNLLNNTGVVTNFSRKNSITGRE